MAIRKFQRTLMGKSTYTCRCCKKLTRETGNSEGAAHLCADCFNLAGIENYLMDNGDLGDYKNEAAALLNARPELVKYFKEVHEELIKNPPDASYMADGADKGL